MAPQSDIGHTVQLGGIHRYMVTWVIWCNNKGIHSDIGHMVPPGRINGEIGHMGLYRGKGSYIGHM